MKRSLIFLLSFCLTVFVTSFYVAVFKDSTAAYSLSVVSFACFVAFYSVGFLGYKIGGNYIQLETKVETLEKENTELKQSVTALAKAIYIVSSENAPAYGFNRAQFSLIDDTLTPINHLIDGDIKAAAEEDLKKIIYHETP